MAVKTQGTKLYIIDPADESILAIDCATSIDGITAAREQIETTCLEDQARTYEAGLATPGTMNVSINYDPTNASHERLHELYTEGLKFNAAIGWSDGTAAPTADSAGNFELPLTRSFLVLLNTFVADFPFDFSQNSVVSSNVSMQLSGFPTLYPKA